PPERLSPSDVYLVFQASGRRGSGQWTNNRKQWTISINTYVDLIWIRVRGSHFFVDLHTVPRRIQHRQIAVLDNRYRSRHQIVVPRNVIDVEFQHQEVRCIACDVGVSYGGDRPADVVRGEGHAVHFGQLQ